MLERIGNKPLESPVTDIGASEKEKRRYSLLAAARRAAAEAGYSDFAAFRKSAEFECEVSEAIAAKIAERNPGYQRRGMLVPSDWLRQRVEHDSPSFFTRDLATGTTAAGGALVATNLLASEYIPPAWNVPVVVRAGARVLSGLVGNVAIPRMSTGVTAGWIATEGSAGTEVDAVFSQVTLSPKDLMCFTDITRRLLLQSTPSAEQVVRDDFAAAIANGVDSAAITGTGSSGQPRGILNTTGIGSAPGGTNGAAWTWSNVVLNIQNVLAANRGDGPLSWALNAQTWGHAARTVKVSGQAAYLLEIAQNNLAGFPYLLSQNLPSNRTKGTGTNLSAAIFGRWSDLLIGEWGTMEFLVDPYSASNTGNVRIRVFMTVDVAVRYAASFSTTDDIVTS
ncbi:MAG: phage major capsid protein [Gammaproteobacteria bacterium]|nr:phage major capsid protein [Gammaproteobacteria bacterium]